MAAVLVPLALALSGLALFWSAMFTWWDEDFPGATYFGLFTFLTGVGAMAIAFGQAGGVPQGFVVAAMIVLGITLPVPWLLFVFAYTGQNEFLARRVGLLLAVLPALGTLSTVLIFGSQFVGWLRIPSLATATGSTAILVVMLTSIQWFALLFAGGLIIIGTGLLVWLFQRYRHLRLTVGALLGVTAIVPWMGLLFAIQLVNVTRGPSIVVLTVAVAVGAVSTLLLGGPSEQNLFSSSPAPGHVASNVIVQELDDVVIVTDRDERIITVNAAAEESLGRAQAALIGSDGAALFGQSLAAIETGELLHLRSRRGKQIFEASTSTLTDPHGHRLGYALLLREQTTQITRRQRLEVLNRILRHNLRNELNVVLGRANQLRARIDDPVARGFVDDIIRRTTGTVGFGETIREIENALDVPRSQLQDCDLNTLLSEVTMEARRRDPDATIEVHSAADLELRQCSPLLDLVLGQLVDNAIRHNDAAEPEVTITTAFDPGDEFPFRITVSDNGPGIPAHEKRVLEAGTETPLKHSSGLGLWAVKWGMANLYGEVEFPAEAGTGATVELTFPRSMVREATAGAEE